MGTLHRKQEPIKRIAADQAGIEVRVESLPGALTARRDENLRRSKQA